MTRAALVQHIAGWLCLAGAASVLAFVAYGFIGPPGPIGLEGLWSEPWFLITMADLYLGVLLAMGFVWLRPGRILVKAGWSLLFVVGGHPALAICHGVQLLTAKYQITPQSTGIL
ncbi:MAG: hypothetical protein MK075_08605, partial [Phycisphaerales bacterium]|nr:hypothetical protein [Phycisphaerales bacterium]